LTVVGVVDVDVFDVIDEALQNKIEDLDVY